MSLTKRGLALLGAVGFLGAASAVSIVGGGVSKEAKAVAGWNAPASVKIATEEVKNSIIDPRADGRTTMTENYWGATHTYVPARETYKPSDRIWEGLPAVVKVGNRIWCAWYTGGTGEPRQFNYVPLSYSDDNGKTWVDPYIIVDHDDDNRDGVSIVLPSLWMDGDDMCLTYVQQATWIIRFHNAGAEDVSKMTWDEPVVFTRHKMNKAPLKFIDSDGTTKWMQPSEREVGDTHNDLTKILVSEDHGATWTLRSTISSTAGNRLYPESQIAQASDGRLILVSRLENGDQGGLERAISRDYGLTWEPYECNLKEPFLGPGSKFHIEQLSSGNLLMVNHDVTGARDHMCAYLSEDNGETWPYKLMLDARKDVSYPYFYETGGKIYVAWDKGRYVEKEIRLSIIDEEDIKRGEIASPGSADKIIINKLNPNYTEITSVLTEISIEPSYPVGTPSSDIRNKLPTSLEVVDNHDVHHAINGVWKSSGYKAEVAGTYHVTFNPSNLPSTLVDTYGLFSRKVVLVDPDAPSDSGEDQPGSGGGESSSTPKGGEESQTSEPSKKGCGGAIASSLIGVAAGFLPILGIAFLKRRNKKD